MAHRLHATCEGKADIQEKVFYKECAVLSLLLRQVTSDVANKWVLLSDLIRFLSLTGGPLFCSWGSPEPFSRAAFGVQGWGGTWHMPGVGLPGSSTGAQKMDQMSDFNAEHRATCCPDFRGVSKCCSVPSSASWCLCRPIRCWHRVEFKF